MRNRVRKSLVKGQVKRLEEALGKGDAQSAEQQFRLLSKQLDKTASTSAMHKGTAARKKSRFSKRLNQLKAG